MPCTPTSLLVMNLIHSQAAGCLVVPTIPMPEPDTWEASLPVGPFGNSATPSSNLITSCPGFFNVATPAAFEL